MSDEPREALKLARHPHEGPCRCIKLESEVSVGYGPEVDFQVVGSDATAAIQTAIDSVASTRVEAERGRVITLQEL